MAGIKAHTRVFGPTAVLLTLAIASFLQIARNAPAFSEELRTESVLGDWRLPVADALYDQGEYNLQIGYGYLRATRLVTVLYAEAELPSDQPFEAWLDRSVPLFEASIAAAPGNVNAWTGLAEARELLGETNDALDALRVSWELAAMNAAAARPRLQVAEGLYSAGMAFSEHDMSAIARDLTVLERFDRGYHSRLMNRAPDALVTIRQTPRRHEHD